MAKELSAKMTQFEAWVNENVLELDKYNEMVEGMTAWMEEKAASHEDLCTEILTSKELVPQKLPDVSDDAIFSRCPLELYRKTVSCFSVLSSGFCVPTIGLVRRNIYPVSFEARSYVSWVPTTPLRSCSWTGESWRRKQPKIGTRTVWRPPSSGMPC